MDKANQTEHNGPIKPTGRHVLHKLSARVTGLEPGRHSDGGNLYLQVDDNGSRRWEFKYMKDGRTHCLGLGGIHAVSVAQAREIAAGLRAALAAGRDPKAERLIARGIPIFEVAAAEVFAAKVRGWKGGETSKQAVGFKSRLETYINPKIGTLKITDVDAEAIKRVVGPIWYSMAPTARKCLGVIGAVLKANKGRFNAIDTKACETAAEALGPQNYTVEPFKSLPAEDVPQLFRDVRTVEAMPAARLALLFLALTGTRTGDVRGLRWREIDREKRQWTVAFGRGKTGQQHHIPLAPEAIGLLDEALALNPGGPDDFVFPGVKRSQPFNVNALSEIMERLGGKGVPHGLRSSFVQWGEEIGGYSRLILDMCLGHDVRNTVQKSYFRHSLLTERRKCLEDWAAFCFDKPKVVRFPQAVA